MIAADALGLPSRYNVPVDHAREQIEKVCRERGIRLLVLFGSRAKGSGRRASDTDLAVLLDRRADLDERFALEDVLAKSLEVKGRLDLIVLNTLESTTLGREIVRTGKVLYDRDGEQWPEFASLAMRKYADFEPYRRRRRQVLRGESIT